MTWHASLPWNWLQQFYRDFRKTFFTAPRPDGQYLVIEDSYNIDRIFGPHSFAPNWELSYNKRGEDFNLARVVREENPNHPDIVWWQCHLRVWHHEEAGEYWLKAHWEPEPSEHPKPHLEGVGFNAARGLSIVKSYLRDHTVPVQERNWSREHGEDVPVTAVAGMPD